MPQSHKNRKQWNDEVRAKATALNPIIKWLEGITSAGTDWGTQKSAHQAMRFLELAQYEMWNMQYWQDSGQARLHEGAEKTTV